MSPGFFAAFGRIEQHLSMLQAEAEATAQAAQTRPARVVLGVR